MNAIDWSPVRRVINEQSSFLVTSHVNPEGDAIGSEVALAGFLRERGKSVRIVNPSPTPENCRFLDPKGEIVLFDADRAGELLAGIEAIFIVDLSSWPQLGPFADTVRRFQSIRVCIDHHRAPDAEIARISVIDETAAAAGLLVYELIRDTGAPISLPIAEALYAALLVDTGSFRFSNTDARALRAAAELVGLGVRPERAYRDAFENRRGAFVRLLPLAFAALGSTSGGKILWVSVTRRMLEEARADFEDTDGYIELLRAVRGVEVCALFKEVEEGRVRVSLRSTGKVELHRFAASFGGGGHAKAAGLTVEGSLEEAVRSVTAGLEALVSG
ncbi:MAG: DHH family phosphoesterase [Candidatus Eisenbacteria bacterium]|nr:DHH family phosphoesterase [Candidatus Eisenbacteria bacterium]